MLPGSIDPRRPDKQQRYKPPAANNNAAPGEDLTPDYMNILDPPRKSMHTSHSRSDRFKVVKIESTEPFKRGRWKCMDFLDQSYNRIFQHNFSTRSPSESQNRPPSPKTPELNKNSSRGSNIDLQSSMLQIFYRQNTSIADSNPCFSHYPPFHEKSTYQNHVLMPGMVSSSLIGIKYPLELNFTPDANASNKKEFINQVCYCKSQITNVIKLQNMSSDHLTQTSTSLPQLNNDTYLQSSASAPNVPFIEPSQQQIFANIYPEQIHQRPSTTNVDPNQSSYLNFQTTMCHSLNKQEPNNNHQLMMISDQKVSSTINNEPEPIDSQLKIPCDSTTDIETFNSVINNNLKDDPPQELFENQEILPQYIASSLVLPIISHNVIMTDKMTSESSLNHRYLLLQQSQASSQPQDVSTCVHSFLNDERNISVKNSSAENQRVAPPHSIDTKIEALMDLVKKHLKFAVLEDVNVLKQRILVLKERVAQLEYENELLKRCEESYKDHI